MNRVRNSRVASPAMRLSTPLLLTQPMPRFMLQQCDGCGRPQVCVEHPPRCKRGGSGSWISASEARRRSSARRAVVSAAAARWRWRKPAATSSSTAATRKALAATAAEIRDRFASRRDRGGRRRLGPRDASRAPRRLSLARHTGQQQWRPAAPRVPRPHPPDDPGWRHAEHDHADRAHQGGHRRHGRARLRPHRQHHLAVGLRADPRPRRLVRRARRPHLVPGRRRPHGR